MVGFDHAPLVDRSKVWNKTGESFFLPYLRVFFAHHSFFSVLTGSQNASTVCYPHSSVLLNSRVTNEMSQITQVGKIVASSWSHKLGFISNILLVRLRHYKII